MMHFGFSDTHVHTQLIQLPFRFFYLCTALNVLNDFTFIWWEKNLQGFTKLLHIHRKSALKFYSFEAGFNCLIAIYIYICVCVKLLD